jgi:integrase
MASISERPKGSGKWYALWRDPNNRQRSKMCGKGTRGKKLAEQLSAKMAAELILDQYEDRTKVDWSEFVEDYFERRQSHNRARSQQSAREALRNFARLARPGLVSRIDAMLIDDYITKRKREPGKRIIKVDAEGRKLKGRVSPGTINRELRVIRAALRCAVRWGYLKTEIDIQMLRENQQQQTAISSEDFALLYDNCSAATLPVMPNGIETAARWRAQFMMIWFSGWRISQTLNLRRDDIDLTAGTAVSRADATGNKGHRAEKIHLHPYVIEDLHAIWPAFTAQVFHWPHNMTTLYLQLDKIAEAAGVEMAWGKKFHEIRRGFATHNASNLDTFELQSLMQHKSLETTKRYIAMGLRPDPTSKLALPAISRKKLTQR